MYKKAKKKCATERHCHTTAIARHRSTKVGGVWTLRYSDRRPERALSKPQSEEIKADAENHLPQTDKWHMAPIPERKKKDQDQERYAYEQPQFRTKSRTSDRNYRKTKADDNNAPQHLQSTHAKPTMVPLHMMSSVTRVIMQQGHRPSQQSPGEQTLKPPTFQQKNYQNNSNEEKRETQPATYTSAPKKQMCRGRHNQAKWRHGAG